MTRDTAPAAAVAPAPPPLLRVDQVAKRLSLSKTYTYMLIARGELRSVTIGKSRRVRPADLEAYIDRLADASPLSPLT